MKNEIILGNGNIGMFPCVLDSESHSSDVALIFVKLPIVKEVGESIDVSPKIAVLMCRWRSGAY